MMQFVIRVLHEQNCCVGVDSLCNIQWGECMLCFNFNIMSLLLSLLTCCLRLCLVVMSLHVEEFFSFWGEGG